MVVIANRHRQTNARRLDSPQFRLDLTVIFDTSVGVGDVAEDDDVPRTRPHRQDAVNAALEPVARMKMKLPLFLQPRVVRGNMQVGDQDGEILVQGNGFLFGPSRRGHRTGADERPRPLQRIPQLRDIDPPRRDAVPRSAPRKAW